MGSQMSGICGSDIFQQLRKKYGQELIKLVIAQKMKGVVRLRFQQLVAQIEGMTKDGKVTVNELGNEKVNLIAKFIEELRNQVDQLLPGGIRGLEKQGGQSIQEISGVTKMKIAVSDIRKRALGLLETEKEIHIKQLKKKQKQFLSKLEKQIPKLQQYNQLKIKVKQQILLKGEEVFFSQIEAKQYEIKKQIDNQIQLETIKDTIHHLIPKHQFNQVTQMIPTDSQNTAVANLESLLKTGHSGYTNIDGINRLIELFQDEGTINYPLTDIDFQESKETQFKTVPYIQTHVDINADGIDAKNSDMGMKSINILTPEATVIEISEIQTEVLSPVVLPSKKPYMNYFYM